MQWEQDQAGRGLNTAVAMDHFQLIVCRLPAPKLSYFGTDR